MFFFFKQKTAYEMRISDWSSDVCSSDLAAVEGQGMRIDHGPAATVDRQIAPRNPVEPAAERPIVARWKFDGEAGAMRQRGQAAEDDRLYFVRQIGRASCRERVCQYV